MLQNQRELWIWEKYVNKFLVQSNVGKKILLRIAYMAPYPGMLLLDREWRPHIIFVECGGFLDLVYGSYLYDLSSVKEDYNSNYDSC